MGPDSSLPNSGFVFRLCLHLSSLDGGDLRLELVVELLQHLLLAGDILAVESRLLLVAI